MAYKHIEDYTLNYDEDEENTVLDEISALLDAVEEDEMYPECPRCKGDRQIEVIVRVAGPYDWDTEHVNCPTCGGTGEAGVRAAAAYLDDLAARCNFTDEQQVAYDLARRQIMEKSDED